MNSGLAPNERFGRDRADRAGRMQMGCHEVADIRPQTSGVGVSGAGIDMSGAGQNDHVHGRAGGMGSFSHGLGMIDRDSGIVVAVDDEQRRRLRGQVSNDGYLVVEVRPLVMAGAKKREYAALMPSGGFGV